MPLIDSSRRRLVTLGAAALASVALTSAAQAATIDVLPMTAQSPPTYTISAPSAPLTPRLVAGDLTSKQITFPASTCEPAGTAVGTSQGTAVGTAQGTAVGTAQAAAATGSGPEGTVPVQESRIATPREGTAPEGDHATPPVGKPARPQPCPESAPEEPRGHETTSGPTGGDKSDELEAEMQRRREQEQRAREILDAMQRQRDAMIRAHS